MADHLAYAYSTAHRSDPEWFVYREFLHLDVRDMQRIKNRRVIALLEEHGDCFDVPVRIDQRPCMPTAVSAEQLQSRLKD
jgi:hypothetical protein